MVPNIRHEGVLVYTTAGGSTTSLLHPILLPIPLLTLLLLLMPSCFPLPVSGGL